MISNKNLRYYIKKENGIGMFPIRKCPYAVFWRQKLIRIFIK